MKLGNTSQTSVPVPNLFLNNNINSIETFKVNKSKKYFREKDLFQKTKEINFSNYTRNLTRKHDNFNKTKHKIDISSLNTFLNKSNATMNNKIFTMPKEDPNKDSYENFRNYMDRTNISKYTSPDLRNEIKTNISVLIDKINHNYDLNRWLQTDTRTNFIDTNTDYLKNKNIFETVKNNFYSTKTEGCKNLKENESFRFKSVIRDKVKGMSINKEYKKKLLAKIDMNNNSFSDKFYKTKNSTIVNINSTDEVLKTEASEEKNNTQMNTLSNLNTQEKIKKNHNINIIDDKIDVKNICFPPVMNKYSTVSSNNLLNQMEVDKLKTTNFRIYNRFDNSNLYRDFPSPDRKEFINKRGEKLRLNTKKDKIDKSLVDFSGYNTTKHRDIFCEKYDTNQGFMEKFKKSKDAFV